MLNVQLRIFSSESETLSFGTKPLAFDLITCLIKAKKLCFKVIGIQQAQWLLRGMEKSHLMFPYELLKHFSLYKFNICFSMM